MRSLLQFLQESPALLQGFPSQGVSQKKAANPREVQSCPSGLTESAKCIYAANHFLKDQVSTVWVCKNNREYELAKSDLLTLIPDDQLVFLPHHGLFVGEASQPEAHAGHERYDAITRVHHSKKPYFLLTTLSVSLEQLIPASWCRSEGLRFKVGKEYPFDEIREQLGDLGYREEPQVENVGEFSIRSSIIDVYPFESEFPIRLDFFDEELEHIHQFELFTQRTRKKSFKKSLLITPCGESIIPQDADLVTPLSPQDRSWLLNARIEGLENDYHHWLRFHYLSKDLSLYDLHVGNWIYSHQSNMHEQVIAFYHQAKIRIDKQDQYPLAPLERILIEPERWKKLQADQNFIDFSDIDWGRGQHQTVHAQQRGGGSLESIQGEVEELQRQGYQTFFVSHSSSQAKRLEGLVSDWEIDGVLTGHLHSGFIWENARLAFFTDHQIFNRISRRQQAKRYQGGVAIPSFDQLKRGDYVIHEEYGVGQFIGTQRIEHGESVYDCLIVEYRGKDRLTLPVSDLEKLEKYLGSEAKAPKLHSLGGKVWEKTKAKAKKSAVKVARELVQLYAKRQFIEGMAFPKDGKMQIDFENSFAYRATPDQDKATLDIKQDLQNSAPMDRLICGDVGFGKTEVAMRAAFKVVSNNKQVAVLVPTTILASQHYQNFQERFSDWPIKIELLNRFRTAKERKSVIERANEGHVDILVGTHALLSEKVNLPHLGLYIIDEEQKFGVKQKEKLRERRLEVDTLAMSATPIPRTLHLSLSGVRDISLITTPPMNRLAVETKVQNFSPEHLAEGIKYELSRGGQCFVVNDHIQELGFLADHIENWVPEARVAIAHGQMNEKDLEQVMAAFVNREYDVLISTTIVENGIDISSANSMFIYNAHRFGISQLYQLRGRVGRGDVQGYTRLFIPEDVNISDESKKRLDALATHTELGSGYQLAMRDLEVRGSGNLLGSEQSGHISEIGIETYIRMVQEAVAELQGQSGLPHIEPEIKIPVESFIPESYIEDGAIRLQIYQRLSRTKQFRDFKDIQNELVDRFGQLPNPVEHLMKFMMLRQACKILGFKVLEITSRAKCLVTPTPELVSRQNYLDKVLQRSDVPWRILYNTPLQIQFELDQRGYIPQLEQLVQIFISMTKQLNEEEVMA